MAISSTINATSAVATPPVSKPSTTPTSAVDKKSTDTTIAPKASTDTVSISGAARAAAAKEAAETPAQTAAEARNGDRQAQRLEAKIATSKP